MRVAASLVLQGPQMSEAVQAHQKAAPVDQAELVAQAESAAGPVLAELVEMFLLFLRPVAEAAGYSYLFRPWLPLPIGEIFLPQRRPTLLALLKGC